jgi:hypothetical protein
MNPATHGQTQKNDVGKANAAMEDCACHPVATVIRIIPLAAGSSESFRLIRHGGECLPFAPRDQLADKSGVCSKTLEPAALSQSARSLKQKSIPADCLLLNQRFRIASVS